MTVGTTELANDCTIIKNIQIDRKLYIYICQTF